MALTPTVLSGIVGAEAVVNSLTGNINAPIVGAEVALTFPTPFLFSETVGAEVTTNFLALQEQISLIGVEVVGKGRIADPRLRIWTASLDQHDWVFLRLGDHETLVYDTYSKHWYVWGDSDLEYWKANVGINWIGGQALALQYGSNIVVGDDNRGILWFMDPELPYDQAHDPALEVQEIPNQRIVQGQISLTGRQVFPVFSAFLSADMGNPAFVGSSVELFTSKDAGETFDSHGSISVTVDKFSPELTWYSLGSFFAPGCLFKIIDDGAIARIDSLDVNDE